MLIFEHNACAYLLFLQSLGAASVLWEERRGECLHNNSNQYLREDCGLQGKNSQPIQLNLCTSDSSPTKIKTTAPLRYKVRPNLALIDGKAAEKVKVVLTAGI